MNHPITGAVYPPHYHDAPGQHHPIDPDAPNPHNAAVVAHLARILEQRRNMHELMYIVGIPAEVYERCVAHLKKAS